MTMHRRLEAALRGAFCLTIAGWAMTQPAHAGLTLNATGLSLGFSLSTYASGGGYYGHFAASALPDGTIVAVDLPNGRLLKYSDSDGQTHGSALATQALAGARNVAKVNGHTYAVSTSGYFEVGSDLGLTPIAVGLTPTWGLWGNPVTGHLLSGTTTGLYSVNPLTGSATFIVNPVALDGVSVSKDGTIVYAALENSGVSAYSIATGTQIFHKPIAGLPGGTGVVMDGALEGHIVAVNHDGTVGLIDPTGATYQTIATGGARGEVASVDLNNGTLFLTFDDQMYRLSLAGGDFGTEAIPEPGSMLLLAAAVTGIGAIRRRTRRT